MSFFDKISALISFGKQKELPEHFFALNISFEKLTASLWTIEGKQLKILEVAEKEYFSKDQIEDCADELLDQVLQNRAIEPHKILFGVPNSWLSDDNLKDDYLKLLRDLVKELELTPMAYVATTHAINHFLEKQNGIPQTCILVGFEEKYLVVTVVRAGKIDGVKILQRGDNCGADIEKALLSFTDVETLPSKILLYGLEKESMDKLKSQLLSFSWMSKLSFLHFPKIEILPNGLEIKSICLAGATELNSEAVFVDGQIKRTEKAKNELLEDKEMENLDNFGFVVGDISKQLEEEEEKESLGEDKEMSSLESREVIQKGNLEVEDFEPTDIAPPTSFALGSSRFSNLARFIPKGNLTLPTILFGILGAAAILIGAYLFLVKAQVKIFVEPRILEKDAQVIADPKQKVVDEEAKIIPGQIMETEVSGSAKDNATGKKQVGDPAKGTVVIYNKTFESKSLSKGTSVTSSNGLKFTLDTSVNIASQSATDSGITFGKTNTTVTASSVGADGNLPSGSELTISNLPSSQISAKSEGNFSGGTSKEVTIVSDSDQKRLLASLASTLRKGAQQKLQEKLPDKKILEEALSEQIVSKSYNKNINDQASEFSLNLTVKFKGTAFDDKDLRGIVSKLVTTQVPDGYNLDLSDTETQADVSKLEKDGRLIFLARFKAKLLPKLDTEKIKQEIKGKQIDGAIETLKNLENVLGAEIKVTPTLPEVLQRLPVLTKNITVEIGLK